MAVEANPAPTLPLPPRASASSPPTVGALLTRASSAVVVTNSGASRNHDCPSPRSLLSRILHRGRGGGGFGCRLRLPLSRYCSSAAAKQDAATARANEEPAAPNVIGSRVEPPRSSLAEKKAPGAEDGLPASLGLGASLVLLLSKSAVELSRMAELRAQMERLMMDVRADVRSCTGRPSASGARSGDGVEGAVPQSRGSRTDSPANRGGGSEDAEHRDTMDRMEAELEAELARLHLASKDEESVTPRREHQAEAEAESGATSGRSHSAVVCSDSDIDDGATDQDGDQDDARDEEDECSESEVGMVESPPHGGVSALELERRLHELLQSRHEARIAELESALERARTKLREKEREAWRWRDTAKLAARLTEESRHR